MSGQLLGAGSVIDVRRVAVTVDVGETVMTRNRLRRELHRLIVSRRFRRVTPDVPALLVMHPHTFEDLALEPPGSGTDDMPLPRGLQPTFRGLPILEEYGLLEHVVEVRWT